MERECIVLSNFDILIMEYIMTTKCVLDIKNNFNIDSSQIKKHLDRLRNIEILNEIKIGTFKNITLNKKGNRLLSILKNE